MNRDKLSGLELDFQGVNQSGELKKWINIVDEMIWTPEKPAVAPVAPIRTEAPVTISVPFPLPSVPMLQQPTLKALPLIERHEDESASPVAQFKPIEELKPEPSEESVPKMREEVKEEIQVESKLEEPSPIQPDLQPVYQQFDESPTGPFGQPIFMEVTDQPNDQAQMSGSQGNYRDIVLRAVDRSLDVLGQDGKQVMLSLLENRYGVHEEEIPEHARGFIEILEEAIGSSAYTVEREIMNEIRRETQIQGVNLSSVVELLKELYPADSPPTSSPAMTIAMEEDAAPESQSQAEASVAGEVKEASRTLEDRSPSGFSYTRNDPIPIGFRYNASFSRQEVEGASET